MTQEMTQGCIKAESPLNCVELEPIMLEKPILTGKIALKPIQARKRKAFIRRLGRILGLLENRSEIAELTRKSVYNPHFHQEGIPVESVKRSVYKNLPCIY